MKISLVATVKDGGDHIEDFLDSIRAQTLPPDEIVLVDGGSTDGTLDTLRKADDIVLIEMPGSNIAEGRNRAIEAATHDVVAVSDADCVVAPEWLSRLATSLESGADVAMGFYRPVTQSFFQVCSAATAVPEPDEVDPGTFMPSSRSVAFRRETFDRAGGYPEWLDIGEDMYLNHRLRAMGARMEFVPEAVAFWRVRPTVAETWHQYYRYARGDALAGMYASRHAIRFGVYGALSWAVAGRRRWALAALGVAAAAYAAPRIRRAFRMLPGRPAERAAAAGLVPAIMALTDVAKMAGYLSGLASPRRR